MFMNKLKSKKGVTIVELMVVVSIISVILLIAIPNYQRFQGKAKQANAKSELATIYGMEQAFLTEFGVFHTNLHLIGYTPDGYPVNAAGTCPAAPVAGLAPGGPVRYYTTGFAPVADVAVNGLPAVAPCPGQDFYASTIPAPAGGPMAATGVLGVGAAGTPVFTITSDGNVNNRVIDRWNINEQKQLVNVAIGF
jgi:prepilin-type N-terminal cleavage/methylation domain-containing protein